LEFVAVVEDRNLFYWNLCGWCYGMETWSISICVAVFKDTETWSIGICVAGV